MYNVSNNVITILWKMVTMTLFDRFLTNRVVALDSLIKYVQIVSKLTTITEIHLIFVCEGKNSLDFALIFCTNDWLVAIDAQHISSGFLIAKTNTSFCIQLPLQTTDIVTARWMYLSIASIAQSFRHMDGATTWQSYLDWALNLLLLFLWFFWFLHFITLKFKVFIFLSVFIST